MGKFSHEHLKTLTALCGGVALLMLVAVSFSGSSAGVFTRANPQLQGAGCFLGICWSDGGTSQVSCGISVSPASITAGDGATVNWACGNYWAYITDSLGNNYGVPGSPQSQECGGSYCGSMSVAPNQSVTYYARPVLPNYTQFPDPMSLYCGGTCSPVTTSASLSVSPAAPPPLPGGSVDNFWPDSTRLAYGGSTWLHWRSSGTVWGCQVFNGPGFGGVNPNDDGQTPALTSGADYGFGCNTNYGFLQISAPHIYVAPPPPPANCSSGTCSISATPVTGNTVYLGDQAQISWRCSPSMYDTSRGDTRYSTGGALSGTATDNPTQNTTYQLTCTAYGNASVSPGSTFGTAQVSVAKPALTLNALDRVHPGDSTAISWDVTNLSSKASCALTTVPASVLSATWGGSGHEWKSSPNQMTGALNQQTTFTITCQAGGSTFSASKTIMMIPAVKEI